ncbi:type II secretion system protein GspD [Thermoproteota archaeon]
MSKNPIIKTFFFTASLLVIMSITITSQPVMTYENEFNIELLNSLSGTKNNTPIPTNLHTIPLKNSDPKLIKQSLSILFPDMSFSIDTRTRCVGFVSDEMVYKQVLSALKTMDEPLQQIQMNVEVIEISCDTINTYKNLFSELTSGFKINYDFTTNKIRSENGLSARLSHLIQTGHAKLLASPSIVTLDNHEAKIKISEKIPYRTAIIHERFTAYQINHIETGINLSILPKISSENIIQAELKTIVETVKLWKTLGDSDYPQIAERHAETTVCIPNTETLVIAGLFSDSLKRNNTRVPLLSDIPFIGSLFCASTYENTRSDIIFLITPILLQP